MDDFVLLMVGAAVIAPDETLLLQPCGTSESQCAQAAPQEIGDGDGVRTKDFSVDTGTRTAEEDTPAKRGNTEYMDCRMSIVLEAQQQTDASTRHERTRHRYVYTAWMGVKQAGHLFCCCGRRCV